MDFANAQVLVNQVMESELGLIFVTTIPDTRPPRFVRTIRTGGYRRDIITDVARLTFECWAETKIEAERDAQQVRVVADSMRGQKYDGIKVHQVDEIAGPDDNPDPDSSTPRYTLTLEFHLRGRYKRSS